MLNLLLLRDLKRLASDKRFARSQVGHALRRGELKKKPCHCGEMKVEAHHIDYSKPLKVVWVCKKHHVELDKIYRKTHTKESYTHVIPK